VLFPLSLALSVGGLNTANHYSMDYELWGRLLLAGATIRYTGIRFGVFRHHEAQKTHQIHEQIMSTLDVAEALLRIATGLDPQTREDISVELRRYRDEYPAMSWRNSGRLARLGLPRSIVNGLRRLRQAGMSPSDLLRLPK
jgi:hypothetical protein